MQITLSNVINSRLLITESHTTTMDNFQKEIKHFREFYDGLGRIYEADNSVTVQQETIGGVNCYWFLPQLLVNDDIVVYLPGGSYAMGSIHSHKALVTHVAAKLNKKILLVNYSLAPEKPFPAGVNDFITVYKYLSAHTTNTRIWVVADSAGGGILLSGLHQLQSNAVPDPAGVVLISAWLDLDCINDSYEDRKEEDPILSREELLRFAGYYSNGRPDANAASLEFRHFPPALIMTGTREVLYDDSRNLYEKLQLLGANATFAEFESQTHVWLLTSIQSAASQQALDAINSFMVK